MIGVNACTIIAVIYTDIINKIRLLPLLQVLHIMVDVVCSPTDDSSSNKTVFTPYSINLLIFKISLVSCTERIFNIKTATSTTAMLYPYITLFSHFPPTGGDFCPPKYNSYVECCRRSDVERMSQ
jgi:hypothetical protein